MNRNTIIRRIAVASALVATQAVVSLAWADHANHNPYRPAPAAAAEQSGLTRAQVSDEVAKARAAGELPRRYRDSAQAAMPSSLTRAEVKAELERARSAGEFPLGYHAGAASQGASGNAFANMNADRAKMDL